MIQNPGGGWTFLPVSGTSRQTLDVSTPMPETLWANNTGATLTV